MKISIKHLPKEEWRIIRKFAFKKKFIDRDEEASHYIWLQWYYDVEWRENTKFSEGSWEHVSLELSRQDADITVRNKKLPWYYR
jgi:hypothetical protein